MARPLLTFAPEQPTTEPTYIKRAPFMIPAQYQNIYNSALYSGQYATYARDGYAANSVLQSALAYKWRAIAQAPLRAYEGDPDAPVKMKPDSPLAQLAARPNRFQSMMEFMMLADVYLNLAGNCYVMLDRPLGRKNDLPDAMYTLRPDRVHIVPDNDSVKGYVYVPEGGSGGDGGPILPQNMTTIKFPHPYDPLEGMGEGLSPMSSLAYSGDVENMGSKFLGNL